MSYWPGNKCPTPFDLVLAALILCLIMGAVVEAAYMCGTMSR